MAGKSGLVLAIAMIVTMMLDTKRNQIAKSSNSNQVAGSHGRDGESLIRVQALASLVTAMVTNQVDPPPVLLLVIVVQLILVVHHQSKL
jgi:hypothetical protein